MKKKYQYQRYFLRFSYNGHPYHGWQIQPTAPSVQGEIERAFQRMGKAVKVVGSSRTDTGVHALRQVAHVDLLKKVVCRDLCHSLNSLLPPYIVMHDIIAVHPLQHARFGAFKRHYIYRIIRCRDPFLHGQRYYLPIPLDVEAMNKGAAYLLGKHNFSSFCKKKSVLPHYECHVQQAVWQEEGDEYAFYITSNRFLHGMVRSIAGTLVDVGIRKRAPETLAEILQSQDRRQAGRSLPPEGLFLAGVMYPPGFFNELESQWG